MPQPGNQLTFGNSPENSCIKVFEDTKAFIATDWGGVPLQT